MKEEQPKQQKEKNSCVLNLYYIRPVGVVFSGFSPEDLDTLLIAHYTGGTNLTDFLGTDTLINPTANMVVYGDTVYLKSDSTQDIGGFCLLQPGIDDRITLLSKGKIFEITGTVNGEDTIKYTTSGPCGLGNQEILPLKNIHINGTADTARVVQDIGTIIKALIYLKP